LTEFIPTRASGIAAMQAFIPAMGERYQTGRNYDHGPGQHTAVSVLSPYIRRRLVTEQEVVTAALAAHGSEAAKTYVEEVIWRGYFKGWLERRPQVWDSYVQGLQADFLSLKRDRQIRRDVDLATSGQTGIDCFDAWVQELVETGYLHNHARMWFASIWIFTLGLPWRLGADFFYRHLLDGDAASNTLGWRWAAGLHTRGKPYPARPQNIATFTHGRFAPRDDDLAEVTHGLEATEPDGLPTVMPIRNVRAPQSGIPTALLITDEDCCLEDFDLSNLDICGTATLSCSHLRSPLNVADAVLAFEAGALADAALRRNASPVHLTATDPETLANWATEVGARQIFTPFVTRGPLRDWLDKAEVILTGSGITLCEQRRDWDDAIWPHATAGFFKIRKHIPRILDQTVLT
jgi:deoxyribodipyrimidine photo-lyase